MMTRVTRIITSDLAVMGFEVSPDPRSEAHVEEATTVDVLERYETLARGLLRRSVLQRNRALRHQNNWLQFSIVLKCSAEIRLQNKMVMKTVTACTEVACIIWAHQCVITACTRMLSDSLRENSNVFEQCNRLKTCVVGMLDITPLSKLDAVISKIYIPQLSNLISSVPKRHSSDKVIAAIHLLEEVAVHWIPDLQKRITYLVSVKSLVQKDADDIVKGIFGRGRSIAAYSSPYCVVAIMNMFIVTSLGDYLARIGQLHHRAFDRTSASAIFMRASMRVVARYGLEHVWMTMPCHAIPDILFIPSMMLFAARRPRTSPLLQFIPTTCQDFIRSQRGTVLHFMLNLCELAHIVLSDAVACVAEVLCGKIGGKEISKMLTTPSAVINDWMRWVLATSFCEAGVTTINLTPPVINMSLFHAMQCCACNNACDGSDWMSSFPIASDGVSALPVCVECCNNWIESTKNADGHAVLTSVATRLVKRATGFGRLPHSAQFDPSAFSHMQIAVANMKMAAVMNPQKHSFQFSTIPAGDSTPDSGYFIVAPTLMCAIMWTLGSPWMLCNRRSAVSRNLSFEVALAINSQMQSENGGLGVGLIRPDGHFSIKNLCDDPDTTFEQSLSQMITVDCGKDKSPSHISFAAVPMTGFPNPKKVLFTLIVTTSVSRSVLPLNASATSIFHAFGGAMDKYVFGNAVIIAEYSTPLGSNLVDPKRMLPSDSMRYFIPRLTGSMHVFCPMDPVMLNIIHGTITENGGVSSDFCEARPKIGFKIAAALLGVFKSDEKGARKVAVDLQFASEPDQITQLFSTLKTICSTDVRKKIDSITS